jgi:Smg protein
MDENLVDVLIYLYENYMDGDNKTPADQSQLEDELAQAGFSNGEIRKALHWLDELADRAESTGDSPSEERSIRIYHESETAHLGVDARGLLLFLEQNRILDPISRELVIDRALALAHQPVTVDELKWIVLLVLMNRPGREAAFTQMEDLVYNENPLALH